MDESIVAAKKKIREAMKRSGDTGKTNWYLLGAPENAKAVGLKDFHKLRGLDHIGFGDFKDNNYQYIRVADTDAGRLMRRVPLVRRNPKKRTRKKKAGIGLGTVAVLGGIGYLIWKYKQ